MNKYYTLNGLEDYQDDHNLPRVDNENSEKIYAKSILSRKPKHIVSNTNLGVDNMSYKFYIATDANNQAYNPKNKNQPKPNFIDRTCKSKYLFKEVNRYVFNKYLKFLKSENEAWIRDINRDLQ